MVMTEDLLDGYCYWCLCRYCCDCGCGRFCSVVSEAVHVHGNVAVTDAVTVCACVYVYDAVNVYVYVYDNAIVHAHVNDPQN